MKLFRAIIILGLSTCWVAKAATVDLTGQGASIDVPDSWTATPAAADDSQTATSTILTALSAEKTSMLLLQVCPNPHGLLAAQPQLITNVKNGITNLVTSHGGSAQFTSESATTLNNVPAYLLQYTETPTTSKSVLARTYLLAANGKLYLMTLRTLDPAGDADLQSIANSFRFASPPTLPVPQVPTHRIRYYLMAGAGVLVLVAAIVGIVIYQRRQIYE